MPTATALSVSGDRTATIPLPVERSSLPATRSVPRILQLLSKLRVDQQKRSFTCEDYPGMSSTLVETVSIDYEDFNESFLTCSLCLCTYDSDERTPKLISCSHTVCLQCLSSIVASNRVEPAGTLRCPICRALVQLPSGGVSALPPSFVVNQLLDLMSRQRREVVPKCSTHQRQDLLFCETCDTVFCAQCSKPDASGQSPCRMSCASATDGNEHTIVPFSVAIKRMSEILLYKVNDCSEKLNEAHQSVKLEAERLSESVDSTVQEINSSFQRLLEELQNRRQALIEQVGKLHQEKKKVLEDQVSLIEKERDKLKKFSENQQQQMDVRNITRKISELNESLDAANCLAEPRENSFVRYNERCESASQLKDVSNMQQLKHGLSQFGKVYTSRTFPPLCELSAFSSAAHLTTTLTLTTLDYHGSRQSSGGDPVTARLTDPDGRASAVSVRDLGSGEYRLQFRPKMPGPHSLQVRVFDRPVKHSPHSFQVSEQNDPVRVAGRSCSEQHRLFQPSAVAVSADDSAIYVADTGNSRLSVYSRRLQVVQQMVGSGLEGRAGVGVAVSGDCLLLVNWRSCQVSRVSRQDGRLLGQFSHEALRQPVAVAAGRTGLHDHCLVADSGLAQVLVFSSSGCLVRRIGQHLKALAGVCMSAGDADNHGCVVTAGASLIVFTTDGIQLRHLITESPVPGVYGGVACDDLGNVLATRSEKSRHYIQVFSLDSGKLQFWIESEGDRLRRPAGLACSSDGSVYVADLANHCVKQYRYL